jgi:hypothetical protein
MTDAEDGDCGGGTARGAAVNRGVVVVVVAVAVVVAVCIGAAEDSPAVAVAAAPAIGAVTSITLEVSKTCVSPPRRIDASVELGGDISECCSRYVECASLRIRTLSLVAGDACLREEERWNRHADDAAERDGDDLEGARQVVARSPRRRILD